MANTPMYRHIRTSAAVRGRGAISIVLGVATPLAIVLVLTSLSAAQSKSGKVVSDARFTSPYDAFMKVNRFSEQPGKDETSLEYWGAMRTRLANQAGRILIKRPEKGFSEDAFNGWMMFLRAYGNYTQIGNCTACHVAPNFTDGKKHQVDRGDPILTPSLRNIGEKKAFFHDGSAKTLEEAIATHVENGAIARQMIRVGVDPELGKVALTEEEIRSVAAFIRTLKTVDRKDFREYLINVVIQPLELDD